MSQRNLFIDKTSASFDKLLNEAIRVHNRRTSDPAKRIHAFKPKSITLEELLILATGYPALKKAIFECLLHSYHNHPAKSMVKSPVVVNLDEICAFDELNKQQEIALLYELMGIDPQFAVAIFKKKDLWEQVKCINNFRKQANVDTRLMFKIFDFLERTGSQSYITHYQAYMDLYHFITQAGSFNANNDRIKLLESIKKLPLVDSIERTLAKESLFIQLKKIKPFLLTYLIADMLKDTLIAPRYFTRKCETYHAISFLETVLIRLKGEPGSGNESTKKRRKCRIIIKKKYEPQQDLKITITGSSSEDESTDNLDNSFYLARPSKISNHRSTSFAPKPQPIPRSEADNDFQFRRYAKSF